MATKRMNELSLISGLIIVLTTKVHNNMLKKYVSIKLREIKLLQ